MMALESTQQTQEITASNVTELVASMREAMRTPGISFNEELAEQLLNVLESQAYKMKELKAEKASLTIQFKEKQKEYSELRRKHTTLMTHHVEITKMLAEKLEFESLTHWKIEEVKANVALSKKKLLKMDDAERTLVKLEKVLDEFQ